MRFAAQPAMGVGRQIGQFAARRLTRRLTRAVPWLGSVAALITLGSTIRRKGWFRGTLDTALDFTPYVGTVKNLAEVTRGRDFIRDKNVTKDPKPRESI
jgi:Pre-toxin TG